MLEGIDHDVADHVNLPSVDTLSQQVLAPALFRDEQVVRDGVGQQAIDLFGHRPVKAAKPGLDVGDRDPQS